MMTGHLPFDDEHMGRLLAKIKTGRYRTLPDYLSTDARDLIKRMLLVDPAKRMTVHNTFYFYRTVYSSLFLLDGRNIKSSLVN